MGLNAYHGDSSACVVIDGKLVAAAEEERFRRINHGAGFPSEAIRYCLNAAGLKPSDIHHVAVNRDPGENALRKILFTISKKPDLKAVKDRLKNAAKMGNLRSVLCQSLGVSEGEVKAKVHNVEHHRAHLASSFFVSPFDRSALVSVDGFGDFVSTMWGEGSQNKIQVKDRVYFPHSLGIFYLAMTQYLGFMEYGDEYKVMGLSAYGEPTEIERLRKIAKLKPKGKFELALDFFLHHSSGVSMTWDGGKPVIGKVYSDKWCELLGPARKKGEPVTDRHENIAASLQFIYEEAFFHLLNHVYARTKNPNLCLAGGCALNSVANGKIFERTKFKSLYIQCAAGDAGGAVGAAYYVWNHALKNPRSFVMDRAYFGPDFSRQEIKSEIDLWNERLKNGNCTFQTIEDEDRLCGETAKAIAEGKIIGWFQGRMEWGPRALGNRSLLCDPRRADMKEILNSRIKRREAFQPFAPVILREKMAEWFETDQDVPFMLEVYPIRKEKQGQIPAVTHVNGSGRLQTVRREQNPRYYKLIQKFHELTGVPVLLNTSFNENEPIVCTPKEAVDCFLRTGMDVLVIGNFMIKREI